MQTWADREVEAQALSPTAQALREQHRDLDSLAGQMDVWEEGGEAGAAARWRPGARSREPRAHDMT